MSKQQKYLFIAILIPIMMISIVAISLLIPVKKISPGYNFLYALGDSAEPFACLQNLAAKFYPQKVSTADYYYKVAPASCKQVRLFVYDFNTDSPTPITVEAAKKLHLTETLPGSDNFYISRNCYTGPDLGLFSMRSTYNDVCLLKDNYRRLINVNLEQVRLFYFMFIGWILPNASASQETMR